MGMNGFTQGEHAGEKTTQGGVLRSGRQDEILMQGCESGTDNKITISKKWGGEQFSAPGTKVFND